MGIIKEKMIQDLVIRGMSKRTQESYLGCIKQFVKYYMKSPDLLTLEDINSYHLADGKASGDISDYIPQSIGRKGDCACSRNVILREAEGKYREDQRVPHNFIFCSPSVYLFLMRIRITIHYTGRLLSCQQTENGFPLDEMFLNGKKELTMNIKNIKFIGPFYKGKKLFFGGSKVYVNR